MKLSKAFVSITSAAALTVSAVAMAAVASAGSTKINDPSVKFDESNVVISFGACSDIHIFDRETDHDTYLKNVLQKYAGLAGGKDKLDAIMIAGDLAEDKPLETYPRIKDMLDTYVSADTTELIPAVGNHDAYFENAFATGVNSFKDKLGSYVYQNPVSYNTEDEVIHGNYHTVINGIHFISVYGIDGNHQQNDMIWLDNQLKKASDENPYMPIFVETHVIPVDTVRGSESTQSETRWYSTTIGPVLEKYPQAVIFAGHTHESGHADNSVWRGEYTAVGTGSVSDDASYYDALDADFVQVDKNGVVRIRSYSSKDNDVNSKPLNEWVFATMEPKFNFPTNDELSSAVLPDADLLNVDFSDGTTKDKASAIEAKVMGSEAVLSDDAKLEKKTAAFDGKGALGYALTADQYAKMKNSTTMSCTFKLNETPASGYVDIFANMNSAGQGFEYTSGKVLQYYLRIGSDYVICEAKDIEAQKWINAIATYDGKEVRLYINGVLADRKPATGDITHQSGKCNVFCLGSDISYEGDYESPANVVISSAKLFSTALNTPQAYLLFSKECNTKIITPGEEAYQAMKGVKYTIPTATATDAFNGDIPVTWTLQNVRGRYLSTSLKDLTPSAVGNYVFTYRANGLLKTQILKVSKYQLLDRDAATLKEGESITLKASLEEFAEDEIAKWESSDSAVATVDASGKVTAVKAGTAKITVTTKNGSTAVCVITVTDKDAPVPEPTTNSTTVPTDPTDPTDPTNSTEAINPTDATDSTDADDSNPKTSDSHAVLPLMLAMVSILATAGLFAAKKMNHVSGK